MALPLDKVRDAEAPLMFISFPSAKDPTWHERNPSNPITVLTLYYNALCELGMHVCNIYLLSLLD